MGLTDVALFFIIAGTNLQWVAASAAAGPTSLYAWAAGCIGMFLPICIVVVFLSGRYPREGGMYVWSTHAFGPFAGFITAWTYWCSTLTYFPALLYFTAGNALYLMGRPGLHGTPAYFIIVSLAGVLIGTVLNYFGLETGKRLINVAAACRSLMIVILIALGAIAWMKFGFATPMNAVSLRPAFDLKELLFWSIIAFAFAGPEALPFMAEEVRNPRQSIPRGLAIAGPSIVAIYVLGTLGLFALINSAKTDSLYGVMQGVVASANHFGGSAFVAVCAAIVVVSCLGSLTAWMGANARLPFVAGLDNYLPPSFGRLHARWGSPVVSLLVQSAIVVVLIVLGQGGTSVKGAYEVLVGSTVLGTMVPFVFMFASGIKLSHGKPLVVIASALGIVTVAGAMVLAAFPGPDDPDKTLAVLKVIGLNAVLIGVGVAFYFARRRVAAPAT